MDNHIRFIRGEKYECEILVTGGSIPYKYFNHYDLIIGYENNNNNLNLICHYNEEIISMKEITGLMQQYAEMIEYLAADE